MILVSLFLLLAGATSAAPSPTTDIDRFIEASENCSLWRADAKQANSSAHTAAARNACAPLAQQLAALRASYAVDAVASKRLSGYDTKTGEALAPLPKDVTTWINRAEQCYFLSGEFNGDNSSRDREVSKQENSLNCVNLTQDLSKLRLHYRQNVRVSWRLTHYDSDAVLLPLVPDDLNAYERQSMDCRKQRSSNCSTLTVALSSLRAKYVSDASGGNPQYCIWDDLHCYDPANGLPVSVTYESDPTTGRTKKDPITGKNLLRINAR